MRTGSTLALLAFSVSLCAAAPLTELERASHALNRIGFGPRPGEVERVAEGGVTTWIERQLEPERIQDPVAELALAQLEHLQLEQSVLVKAYRDELRRRQQMQREKAENPAASAAEPAMMESADRLLVANTLGELQHAKMLRAVLSERQLQEALADFWFNHFNVDARKQQVRPMVMPYERDVIRPNLFGSFRELLGAVASSGAMLVYLDNWRSSKEMSEAEEEMGRRARRRAEMDEADAPPAARRARGLNENYGRELLELHTLGVDAGYTQEDVQEAARALTGWTIEPSTGAFLFRDRLHDKEAKRVFGLQIASGGGREDGEKLLDYLARHPATSRRIAFKLCQRFVSDSPPDDYVERVALAFRRSGGDLRQTYRALFLDPAFFAPENVGAKIKSPFEFTASSLRALGASFQPVPLARRGASPRALEAAAMSGRAEERIARLPRKTVTLHLIEMGQTPYVFSAPTGFPEDSSHWVSAGALVSRLNFALALTSGQVADVKVDLRSLVGDADPDDPKAVVDHLSRSVLGRAASEETVRVMLGAEGERSMGTSVPDVKRLAALIVGSPEFQRR